MPDVLILGADGFIGRHIAFALRRDGWTVLTCARRTARLERMGFATLRADLADPATHDPGFWSDALSGAQAVVNAAGLLTGPEHRFQAVHHHAPQALYDAMPNGCTGLLISAVGIDTADTPFARHRRAGEALAGEHGLIILRPGLVLGDTSYGGSSLLRALAACPLVTPVIGNGDQPFNPIHADDLAQSVSGLLNNPPDPGTYPIGGREQVTQAGMLRTYRSWLGLPAVPLLHLPPGVARAIGRIGDLLQLGPISRTSVAQLTAGVLAPPTSLAQVSARPFSEFSTARPAGTQDLWHARLYLFRPVLRLALAFLWLASGLIGLFLTPAQFLPLLPAGFLPDPVLIALARLGGLADLAIALALLRGWRLRMMAAAQLAMVLIYTVAFSLLAPALWLLPLGGLLKNIPIIVLILLHAVLEDER